MTRQTCVACERRPAAAGHDHCLGCISTAASAPQETVDQEDPAPEIRLATNGPGGALRGCEQCGAPARAINLFGGVGIYRCTRKACGHESETAIDREGT